MRSSDRRFEILIVAIVMGAALFATAFALNIDDGGAFVSFVAFLGAFIAVLFRVGVMGFLSGVSQRHRKVLILAAFVVAFLFPFTQGGSDANMSIATQVIIFAAAAMGLNITVGLAGLLDLGYIAFLGAGAFTAAVLSRSAFATADIHPPFIVVVLIAGAVSATLGLIIGSPTLRVSGDYLAIVTLAFGEIFRITMINLDGEAGPNITHGSNGIPAIPDLTLFGFDFGDPHVVLGIPLGRFSNYYFLLLVVIASDHPGVRPTEQHPHRPWLGGDPGGREGGRGHGRERVRAEAVRIRKWRVPRRRGGRDQGPSDMSVTPDQFMFLESAFLLAAIVLGGMGTVVGVLVGATLLKLMPEKLRFVSEYRLMIFALLLVMMMRFRPEGMMPSQRRQLEFHEEDEELAERIEEEVEETGVVRGAGDSDDDDTRRP